MIEGPGFDADAVPRFTAYDPDTNPEKTSTTAGWQVTHQYPLSPDLPPGIYAGRFVYGSGKRYDVTSGAPPVQHEHLATTAISSARNASRTCGSRRTATTTTYAPTATSTRTRACWVTTACSSSPDAANTGPHPPTRRCRTSSRTAATGAHTLRYRRWSGSAWSDWGGQFVGEPTTAAYRGRHVSVMAVDVQGRLRQKRWDGTSWSPPGIGWQDMGGTLGPRPAVCPWGARH